MVAAHCATFSFLCPPTASVGGGAAIVTVTNQRKALNLSSNAAPFPSRHRKRKNYLRPKLLETLTKPYPTPSHLFQESPLIIESEEILEGVSFNQTSGESFTLVGDDDRIAHRIETESREFVIQPTSGGLTESENGDAGIFSTGSLLKLGMCLVGIFVFQTICAVWLLGSAQEHDIEASEAKGSELGSNESSKGKFLSHAGSKSFVEKNGYKPTIAVHRNESELEEKIVEIRSMAREARERERKKPKSKGSQSHLGEIGDDETEEDAISSVRSGIQEEVDARVTKLQKRLEVTRKKSPMSSINYLNKSGKVEDRVNGDDSHVAESNRTLMFKKKMKLRTAPSMPRDNPKGFQPLENSDISKKKRSSSSTVDKMPQNDSFSPEEDHVRKPPSKESNSSQNRGKKLEKGRGVKNMGGFVNAEFRNVKRQPNEKEMKNSQSSTIENQNTVTNPDAVLSISKPVAKGFRDKSSGTKADLWWLHLPYVMAVLMRRGSNQEGEGGLYNLKIASNESDPVDLSYTVAFEDRGDANNFCYLLESFFEDLGDFSADIVPLSIKELHEAVKSDGMKVIVVRKGQLQLYAGQPLADVEMALCSLIE